MEDIMKATKSLEKRLKVLLLLIKSVTKKFKLTYSDKVMDFLVCHYKH